MNRLLLLCALFLSNTALADKVYVHDILYVPIRGGQTIEHRILHKGIKSGTALERLSINEETGFTQVITEKGIKGWIKSQYLVTTPIARVLLAETRQELTSLQGDYQEFQSRVLEQRQELDESVLTMGSLQKENNTLAMQLENLKELSADVISVHQQNQSLKAKELELNQEIDNLMSSNSELQNASNQTWFMIGAGAILLGLIFGIWLPRAMASKQGNWS